jgi:hypothetical protein
VRIEDPRTGMPLVAEDRIWEIQWPLRFQMPEGEYRVVVEGAPSVEFFRRTLGTPRSGGRYVETLRVPRGATVEVQARIPEGARVRLSVRGEVRPEDVAAFAQRHPRADKEYATFWTGRASVVLIADSGWPESVQFTYEEAGTSAPGTHLTGTIPLGVPSVSQVLPAGRFRLEVRMPGGRIASQEVVLAAGQVTDVALDLGP